MPITEEIVAAFLKCETKAYLKQRGVLGVQTEVSQLRQHQRNEYRESCRALLCSAASTASSGTPDLQSLKNRHHDLILDYEVAQGEIQARLDALVLNRAKRAKRDCPYTPVRFVPFEKASADDKLLLAFDAVAFSKAYGRLPLVGRIIHGGSHAIANIPVSALIGRIQRVLKVISNQANATPPRPALNKHCAECEFQSRCREIAIEKDDLSLLKTLFRQGAKKAERERNLHGAPILLHLPISEAFGTRFAKALPFAQSSRHQKEPNSRSWLASI
jgi:predicted RecB family nuclease